MDVEGVLTRNHHADCPYHEPNGWIKEFRDLLEGILWQQCCVQNMIMTAKQLPTKASAGGVVSLGTTSLFSRYTQ